jgi:hypothetical protein
MPCGRMQRRLRLPAPGQVTVRSRLQGSPLRSGTCCARRWRRTWRGATLSRLWRRLQAGEGEKIKHQRHPAQLAQSRGARSGTHSVAVRRCSPSCGWWRRELHITCLSRATAVCSTCAAAARRCPPPAVAGSLRIAISQILLLSGTALPWRWLGSADVLLARLARSRCAGRTHGIVACCRRRRRGAAASHDWWRRDLRLILF